jgi:glycosyltransferase involved in cell wall biosynthesis
VTVITSGNGDDVVVGPVRYITVPVPSMLYPLQALVFAASAAARLRVLDDLDLVETHHDSGATALLAFPGGRPPRGVFVEVVHGVFRDELAAVLRHDRLMTVEALRALGLLPLSLLEQMASRQATAVITVSHYAASQVSRRYGIAPERIHVIPNGIDTTRYVPGWPRQHHDAAAPTVLYVGRWHARKGVRQLLEGFAIAHREVPALRLKLIGGGPLESELRADAARLGLNDAVMFLSRLSDEQIIEHYRASEIVCVPSLQEGQGIVALEAQACGTPVVATRAGGLAEAVRDRATGVLVPPGDPNALGEALRDLARDRARRSSYALAAEAWASSFAWDRTLAAQAQLYNQLIGRSEMLVAPCV